MTQVVRLSKQGVNVLTATDPNDFILHELYSTFKILSKGTYSPTLAHAGTSEQYTVVNVSGSDPFAIVFCKFTNGRVGPPGTKDSANNFWFTNVRSVGGQLHLFYINDTGGNYQPVFKYYLTEVPL